LRLQPLVGGSPRPFLVELAVNVDWSSDGTRVAYHTSNTGDPLLVADRDGANAKQLVVGEPETHQHFPTWSPDGQWIYFVRLPSNQTESDLWRIAATGGEPERLTQSNSYLGYPTPLDERTLLYVGEDQDGAGPWLWALDVETRVTRRLSFGLEKYTSIAASADRRRLAAVVANPVANLWSVPVLDHAATEGDVQPYPRRERWRHALPERPCTICRRSVAAMACGASRTDRRRRYGEVPGVRCWNRPPFPPMESGSRW